MIRRSDNVDGAARILRHGGQRAALAPGGARRAGMDAVHAGRRSRGGRSRAHGARTRLAVLPAAARRCCPERHRGVRAAACSGALIAPSQRWGIGPGHPGRAGALYFKGGWGSGSGAVDHQVGAAARAAAHRVSIAVMTVGNPGARVREGDARGRCRAGCCAAWSPVADRGRAARRAAQFSPSSMVPGDASRVRGVGRRSAAAGPPRAPRQRAASGRRSAQALPGWRVVAPDQRGHAAHRAARATTAARRTWPTPRS